MKSRSEQPELSKVAAAAGITPAQRELEAVGGRTSTLTRDSTLERESAFERSISTTRPAPLATIDLSLNVVTSGKLTWRTVLAWLRDDKLVSPRTSSAPRGASPAATASSTRSCASAASA